MRVSFQTRERKRDGSPREGGVVPAGAFRIRAEGLAPGATLTVALIRGAKRRQQTITADAQGEISVTRVVGDPDIMAVLESLGSASWSFGGANPPPMRAAADDFAIELTVG